MRLRENVVLFKEHEYYLRRKYLAFLFFFLSFLRVKNIKI